MPVLLYHYNVSLLTLNLRKRLVTDSTLSWRITVDAALSSAHCTDVANVADVSDAYVD
jgi:hypothetical protein